jgi:hypothetical protein
MQTGASIALAVASPDAEVPWCLQSASTSTVLASHYTIKSGTIPPASRVPRAALPSATRGPDRGATRPDRGESPADHPALTQRKFAVLRD